MPLLRASAFCRPSLSPCPVVRLELYRPPLAGGTVAPSHTMAGAAVAASESCTDDDGKEEGTRWCDEESLVALVSLEFLQAFRMMAGAVVWVELVGCEQQHEQEEVEEKGGDGIVVARTAVRRRRERRQSSHRYRRVPARLRLLPPTITTACVPPVGGSSNNDDDDNDTQHVVYLSPMAAANLDLYSNSNSHNENSNGGSWKGRLWPLSTDKAMTTTPLSASGRLPLEASAAVLTVWGKPVRSSLRLPDQLRQRRRRRPRRSSSVGHPSAPSGPQEPGVVPLPPSGSLLHTGSILSVASSSAGSEIYFFQVLSVQVAAKEVAGASSSSSSWVAREEGGSLSPVAQGTMSTLYTIVENPIEAGSAGGAIESSRVPLIGPPQLPPLNEALNFLRPRYPPSRASLPVPHPDVPRLAERFRRGARARSLSECTISVVGTDRDHHVTTALHQAAAASGRRCVDMGHSWATFGYLHGGRGGGGRSSSSTVSAALSSSGTLSDKLRGLDAAAELATQHAPSVLVLRLDNELSTDRHDRHDQESRVWSALSRVAERKTVAWGTAGCVMVVLVSGGALDGDGPLAQRLISAPYSASHPDDEYIRHLWDEPSGALDEECVELLRGRPAAEIERAFRLARADVDFSQSNGRDLVQLMKQCCGKVDQERRTRSHAQSRIPSVRWEDIGGLDHVRREILETIELPLRYPHLLPKNSENLRTGLLLWGPPGTGKTLVAKAVATECSLPFVSVRGPELMGSYIGESEENVRNVFASARRLASQNLPPAAVLFFDELDSLAPRRGGRSSGGNVTDRVVATLFAELERKAEGVKVFCMGATNRPDLLDPALLRPGRLDRLVYMGADASDHFSILHAQIRRLHLDGDAKEMAFFVAKNLSANLTGADLSTIATTALVRATDRLCAEADNELMRRQNEGEAITLEEVLQSWDDARLKPSVTLEDLVESSKRVVPSVDKSEIRRYSSLRDSFLSNSQGQD